MPIFCLSINNQHPNCTSHAAQCPSWTRVSVHLLVFRDLEKLGSHVRKTALLQQQSIKTEWKLAKIAFVVIIVFVLSWSPYASVTLIAWAGYGTINNIIYIYIDAFSRRFYPKRLTVLYMYYQYVFPGNRTHNLCAANTPLYH